MSYKFIEIHYLGDEIKITRRVYLFNHIEFFFLGLIHRKNFNFFFQMFSQIFLDGNWTLEIGKNKITLIASVILI